MPTRGRGFPLPRPAAFEARCVGVILFLIAAVPAAADAGDGSLMRFPGEAWESAEPAAEGFDAARLDDAGRAELRADLVDHAHAHARPGVDGLVTDWEFRIVRATRR